MVQSVRGLRNFTAPDETGTATFDFGANGMLGAGVTITGVAAIGITVSSTSPVPDANVASRIIGSWQIGTSPASGLANQAVLQMFGTFVRGVIYAVRCTASASDGTHPELWQYWGSDYPA